MSTAERLVLARDLHDGIAQDLVALGYELDLAMSDSSLAPQLRSQIRAARFSVDDLISKVRRQMYELRDQENESLQEVLIFHAQQICGDNLKRINIEDFALPSPVAAAVQAIAIELLRNCISHSRGSEIELSLTQLENHTYLEVRDNGQGGATLDSSRLGLIGIYEQVESLNGKISVISNEHGTQVAVTL